MESGLITTLSSASTGTLFGGCIVGGGSGFGVEIGLGAGFAESGSDGVVTAESGFGFTSLGATLIKSIYDNYK